VGFRRFPNRVFLFFMVDETTFIKRYILIIEKKANDLGLNHSDLARKVFTSVKDPARTWRAIREEREEGKPRQLTFLEAVALANQVGSDIAAISLEVRELIALKNPSPKSNQRSNLKSLRPYLRLLPGRKN